MRLEIKEEAQFAVGLRVIRVGRWRLFRSPSLSYWRHDTDEWEHEDLAERHKMASDLRWKRQREGR